MTTTLSITARAPVIRQGVDSFNERLATEKEAFSMAAGVGFDKAKFILYGDMDYLQDWFAAGLARDIIWRGPAGAVVWNGFVDKLTLTEGGTARSRSLNGVANRVFFVYTPLDTTANPPTSGALTTLTVNDTASQDQLGIKTASLSGGEVTTAAASVAANTALTELARIKVDEALNFGKGAPPSLQIEMKGYAYMLDWFNYNQTASSGTASVSTVIAAILAADPNGVISTSTVDIDSNANLVEQFQDGKKPAWKLIQELAGRGSAANNRWLAAVYAGRRVVFKQAETIDSRDNPLAANNYLTLHKNPYDTGDRLFDQAGRELFPWEVRPDRLIYTAGFPGPPKYVESASYTAPYGLQTKNSDLNPLARVVQ